ncbi:MAG: DsrE/DsrF/TusD sulfur relay family protein [Campylobacterales bacterium]
MKHLFIINTQPYDGSDVVYNALRLAKTLHEKKQEVKIFLMNDGVDLARDETKKPQFYEYDLVEMLKSMYQDGISLQVCGSCQARCGINKNAPYFDENIKSTMGILADWSIECDKVYCF